MHIHKYVCTHMHTYIYMHTHMHIHTYTYIPEHKHIIHVHAHVNTLCTLHNVFTRFIRLLRKASNTYYAQCYFVD